MKCWQFSGGKSGKYIVEAGGERLTLYGCYCLVFERFSNWNSILLKIKLS